jgi:selenide,water dikinase
LVGINTADDAAVYRMDDDLALIQTVDFFPPIVDDPVAFGKIAVANALSDVYAMGGKPILAMNIVGFPVDLPKDILGSVLKGGSDKAMEAGVLIVGGHTVDDAEPKYGLAVTGIIKPGDQVTNANAKVGDTLVLTKPLGMGIITTAGKQQKISAELLSEAVEVMATLNKAAAEAMMRVGVNSCTDVTGFGLLGHLHGMVEGSGVAARLRFSEIPFMDGVFDLIEAGIAPGGSYRNLSSAEAYTAFNDGLYEHAPILLADAQTSGGLLISVESDKTADLLSELEASGVETRAVIGDIVDRAELDDGVQIEVQA